jgi:hypothetical protein
MIKNKSLKPIDYDVHLKYRCPSCSQDHWLSLKQCQTKGFKVVCDCNEVFKPKRIDKFNISFHKKKKPSSDTVDVETIPQKLLNNATQVLVGYGFSKAEAELLINKAYATSPTNSLGDLIKQSLKLQQIGENNG